MNNDAIAAATDDGTTTTEDTLEITTPPATGDTTDTTQSVTTEATDGDDEGDVTSSESDGKIDAVKVNEIVKRRVEKVRNKTREEAEAKAAEEIEFWRGKAQGQKQETAIVQVPPQPKAEDYGSNPTQYAKDMETWAKLKSQSESYTQNVHAAYAARANEFLKDKPDFTKSVQFFNSVTVEPALNASILESEQGPALAYYFSKNFKEFDRVNKLSPVSIAREVAKLELKLTGQLKETITPVEKKVLPKVTTPVSGAAVASTNPATMVQTEAGRQKFLEERKKAHLKGVLRRS